jgi:hypothetical protein
MVRRVRGKSATPTCEQLEYAVVTREEGMSYPLEHSVDKRENGNEDEVGGVVGQAVEHKLGQEHDCIEAVHYSRQRVSNHTFAKMSASQTVVAAEVEHKSALSICGRHGVQDGPYDHIHKKHRLDEKCIDEITSKWVQPQ